CDNDFNQDRTLLPMSQSFRGKQILASIKILNFGRNNEELDLWTHTNEPLYSICNRILTTLKMSGNVDVELFNMGDKIDLTSVKLISHLSPKEKLNLSARLTNSSTNISSSPDFEYSDSRNKLEARKKHFCHKQENLPGVIMSKKTTYANFL